MLEKIAGIYYFAHASDRDVSFLPDSIMQLVKQLSGRA
jgi:hypothetical protein